MFIEILFKILLFKGSVLIYAEHCMCFLHIVFYIVFKYRYCLYVHLFFLHCLEHAHEFHSPRHLWCGDVTIKVIRFDLQSMHESARMCS